MSLIENFKEQLISLEAISNDVHHQFIKSWGNQEATDTQKSDALTIAKNIVLGLNKYLSKELNQEVRIEVELSAHTDMNSNDQPTIYCSSEFHVFDKNNKEIFLDKVSAELLTEVQAVTDDMAESVKHSFGNTETKIRG